MRASNLARNFLDDLCPEPPKGSQPFKAAHPIFGSQEVLFHRPNENAQGRHEPNPKDLAGPDCIPVVGGDDGRLPAWKPSSTEPCIMSYSEAHRALGAG